MRFISQYPNYGVQVRPQRVHPLGDGTSQVIQEPLYVTFLHADKGGMIFEKERYQAAQHFNFHGSQQEQDEATPIDPIHRLSILDTVEMKAEQKWTDEDVAEIETTLLRKTQTTPLAVMVMEETPVTAPFPTYDAYEGTPDQLVLKLVEDGYDLGEVLLYERRYGQNRPQVVEALEEGIESIKELVVSG